MSKTLEELGLGYLGYIPTVKNKDLQRWTYYGYEYKKVIDFNLKDKTVLPKIIHRETNEISDNGGFTMEELKAIYKYCEDNKWI